MRTPVIRPEMEDVIHAIEEAVHDKDLEGATWIGLAVYDVATADERALLETYLGPNAATEQAAI
ncbi:hypothetical protein ABZ916_32015 [Streptomyces sp. NPDC046853]|uniref:hypothetical protein n=1 Tax=Streptomyces sp. NPDC046853 TaxID=3154920 RepID=UPI0033DECE23